MGTIKLIQSCFSMWQVPSQSTVISWEMAQSPETVNVYFSTFRFLPLLHISTKNRGAIIAIRTRAITGKSTVEKIYFKSVYLRYKCHISKLLKTWVKCKTLIGDLITSSIFLFPKQAHRFLYTSFLTNVSLVVCTPLWIVTYFKGE